MLAKKIQPGEWLIYRKSKHSGHPGPRAKNISPAPHGDDYAYYVDKFWIAKNLTEDGKVLIITRRGKEFCISVDDPNLRRARWWERLVYRSRFKSIEPKLEVST